MKGFWSTFSIFLLWATAGIYYIHIKESKDIFEKSPIDIPIKKDNTTPLTSINHIKPEITKSETNKVDSTNTTNVLDTTISSQPSYDSIEDDNLYLNSNTNVDSQLLAEEIKKSIAISDTIDINKDEPAIEYKKEVAVDNSTNTTSQIFYPTYKNTDLIIDKELINYATELKQILKANPNKKVIIIGHTDNVGNAEDNFKIALKKSRQIKWYLTSRRGIKRSKISAISKGESTPKESNTSVWGREKNNRIEIIVD